MKKQILIFTAVVCGMTCTTTAYAQFKIGGKKINVGKVVQAGTDAAKAITLSDADIAAMSREYMQWMDTHNPLTKPDTEYGKRLEKLTGHIKEVDGLKVNFGVYEVVDVNAFACGDGSVRICAGLMDIMTDDELLGVIGHEVGHVAHKDSKNGFRTALLTSALKDGISSQGGTAAKLSDSQLGDLGEALVNSTYSQKQERSADDYGYEFLKSHGKNPWAMALSFQKLKKLQEEAGAQKSSKLNQLFSTHPDLDARIQRMEERATSEGIEKPAVTE